MSLERRSKGWKDIHGDEGRGREKRWTDGRIQGGGGGGRREKKRKRKKREEKVEEEEEEKK